MNDQSRDIDEITRQLRAFQTDKKIVAFSVKEQEDRPSVWISWTGQTIDKKVEDYIRAFNSKKTRLDQEFYFLSDELRPGSGLIRVFGGKSEGPGGTLTCLLSSRDGQDEYLASAGHVLTNFWKETTPTPEGSIYRYRKGFPATSSIRFLGKLVSVFPATLQTVKERPHGPGADIDLGIVKIEGVDSITLKQRTTCYGSFGEWPPKGSSCVERFQRVMKCGSQESHWTEAEVWCPSAEVPIYGPDGHLYRFTNQVLLTDLRRRRTKGGRCDEPLPEDDYPRNPEGTPFAVPGDSGTMVVDKQTKRPVGMLIAGSILNGLYVMTPFETIQARLEKMRLVMSRA
jgi:hypothetical protein